MFVVESKFIVAFRPVRDEVFSRGKTPSALLMLLLRLPRWGKVVGKQRAEATMTMVP